MIHNWLPVNAHAGVNKTGIASYCPFCQAVPETFEHLCTCTHPVALHSRVSMMTAIRQHLQRSKTSSKLTTMILSALLSEEPQVHPSLTTLHAQQQAIGWQHILRGNLSLSWVRTYDSIHHCNRGKQWCISLLRKIWTEFHALWKRRCDHYHGATVSLRREQLLREVTPRIHQLYQDQEQLLHIDHQFFNTPQDRLLSLPTAQLEN
jgi:hypothetical protein